MIPIEMTDAMRRCMHREPALRKPNANHNTNNTGATAKLERIASNEPLASSERKAESPSRIHLSIVSIRKRLCDPDNLSPKGLIDCLRYCGAIPGDEPDKITLETSQRKAEKGEAERTEITITYP